MGFANSPAMRSVLASHGIQVSGYRWRWAPGLKGGTFPPHRHVNGQVRTYEEDFDATPGDDVNGDACMCALVPAYRTPDGRMAKPGLTPVFQPPVTAALPVVVEQAPIDWTPLQDFLTRMAPPELVVPDGAFGVNVHVPRQVPAEIRFDPTITPPDVHATFNPTFNPSFNPSFAVEPPQVSVTVDVPPAVSVPKEYTYFAGINGKVVIPKTHAIVAWSCTVGKKAGTVKIGSNPLIRVPVNTSFNDDFDDLDPMKATTLLFKNTDAYSVKAVRV